MIAKEMIRVSVCAM